jgi:hypothetical protein
MRWKKMNNEDKVVKVMTDEEWASLSEESRQNLITLFSYNQFPPPSASPVERIFKDDRELSVLHAVMLRNEMSAEAVVRHFFRMGQLVDYHLQRDEELGVLDDQGDFRPIFQRDLKLAPMPACTCEQTDGQSCPIPFHQPATDSWENEGGS